MKATKIKMKPGHETSNNLLDIDSIFLVDDYNVGYFEKQIICNYLKKYPHSIQVDIQPFPNLIPALSANGEMYLKSSPNNTKKDNLLNLPRK